MKLSQKNIIRIILLSFIVLYNFLLFMITGSTNRTEVFWVAYGFIMLLPVLFFLLTFSPLPFAEGTKLILSLPIYKMMVCYATAEFVVGTLLMVFQKFISVKVALLIQIPLLIIFLIVVLILYLGATRISEKYEEQKKDVFALNSLYISVKIMQGKVQGAYLAQKIMELADKIKYSDFNSYLETAEIEEEIKNAVNTLGDSLADEAEALKCVSIVDSLVEERREICKFIKKKLS